MNYQSCKLTKSKIYSCPPRSRGKQNNKLENIPWQKYITDFEKIFKSNPQPGYNHYYIVPALVLSLSDFERYRYMEIIGKIMQKYGIKWMNDDKEYIHFIIQFTN